MITYNADKHTFSSNCKVYTIEEVTEKLMYEWVKTGQVNFKSFNAWLFYRNN